jgi:hypothetical protein
MPRRSSCAGSEATERPSIVIDPLDGSIMRLIMRSVVVFPLPDVPTSTPTSPVGISSDSASTATVPSSYRLVTRSSTITAPVLP